MDRSTKMTCMGCGARKRIEQHLDRYDHLLPPRVETCDACGARHKMIDLGWKVEWELLNKQSVAGDKPLHPRLAPYADLMEAWDKVQEGDWEMGAVQAHGHYPVFNEWEVDGLPLGEFGIKADAEFAVLARRDVPRLLRLCQELLDEPDRPVTPKVSTTPALERLKKTAQEFEDWAMSARSRPKPGFWERLREWLRSRA